MGSRLIEYNELGHLRLYSCLLAKPPSQTHQHQIFSNRLFFIIKKKFVISLHFFKVSLDSSTYYKTTRIIGQTTFSFDLFCIIISLIQIYSTTPPPSFNFFFIILYIASYGEPNKVSDSQSMILSFQWIIRVFISTNLVY